MCKKINLILVFGLLFTLQCAEDNSDCLSYGDIQYKYLFYSIVVSNDTIIEHYVFIPKVETIKENDLKAFSLYYGQNNLDASFINILDEKYISIEDLEEKHRKYFIALKRDSNGVRIDYWSKKF